MRSGPLNRGPVATTSLGFCRAEPSRANEYLTQTLKTALALVEVRVLDHLVVAGADVCSFAESGLA